MTTPSAASRPELLGTKLRALVGAHWGPDGLEQLGTFPGGAAGQAGSCAWVLAEQDPERALGPALAWARQAGASQLHLLIEPAGGRLARRASLFATPAQVWRIRGRALEAAEPEALVPGVALGPEMTSLIGRLGPVMTSLGAELVAHPDGSLRVEVLGLEVARVVLAPGADGSAPGLRLDVGVGHHDRDAHRMVAGDLDADALGDLDGPVAAALDQVVSQVRRHRRAGVASHPANQLAPERWLRAVLVARPDLAGLTSLTPVELPGLPSVLGVRGPAGALGHDPAGQPALVVCSTGVDLDLVPTAADARLAVMGETAPRLVLAVPAADDLPVTRALASALAQPAEMRPVDAAWQEASGG